MIFRRLSNSVRNQDWFTVLIEIVIVVVGVFIGIEVSNWNEARVNRNIGQVYTERLITDLENEAAIWTHFSTYYRNASDHALAALESFRKDPADLDEQFLIDLYQASQRWNASADRGTFDEILSTGRIETVAGSETRRLLSNYYGRQSGVVDTLNERTDYRRMVRELMDDRVQSAVRARCDDRYVRGGQNFVYLQLPEQCEIELPNALVREEIDRLHANQELRLKLRFQKNVLDGKLGSLGNAYETAQLTLAAMKETDG